MCIATRAIRSSLLLLLLLLPGALLAQQSFSGRVVRVIDGDTLVVNRNGQDVTVRLYGIDCPEGDQAFGQAATEFLKGKLPEGSPVSVTAHDRDASGRTVAEVFTADGQSTGELLVRSGLAWWYHWYAPEQRILGFLETEARAKRLGLWADASPTPPWSYRTLPHETPAVTPPPPGIETRIMIRETPPPSAAAGSAQQKVFLDPDGERFHLRSCRTLSRSKTVVEMTVQEALARGKTACPVCHPLAPAAVEQKAVRPAAGKASGVVFITSTGRKYHREGCRELDASKKPITRGLAEVQGYTPCSKCKP
jgi:endonuclease YncB( thermonuclease family)